MLGSGFYNMDCMDAMKQFPDGFFDLAVVDPPYGDAGGGVEDRPTIRSMVRPIQALCGTDSANDSRSTNARQRSGGGGGKSVCRTGGTWADKYDKKIIAWDTAPDQEYFDELFRVSKHQIIWGGNYFQLPPTRCFIVWRKLTISESFSMAMCEYAWTNFFDNAKLFECAPQGTSKEKRFHPTQKPIRLYEWLLSRYAKAGYKILDTHVGSASSLIACHRAGLEYWGFEIDEQYYKKASERLEREKAQISMFDRED